VQEAKGKKKERHVYLSKTALAITKRLMMKYPKGPLFRRNDVPWDRYMVSNEFDKLKEEIGFKYRLYDWRHSYITNALKNGVDPITLQHLVGHKDLSMISRVYAKVQQDIGYMRRAASKAVQ
jgi:integrase